MTNRFLTFFTLFLVLLVFSAPVAAQSCTAPYELIFNMKDGRLGSYNVWDAIYGEQDSEERFASAVPVAGGNHNVAAGVFYEAPGAAAKLLLVRLDHRGREVWKQTHEVENLDDVAKILPYGEGFIVFAKTAGAKKLRGAWVGEFDETGGLIRWHSITEPGKHLSVTDVIPTHDGKGYLMAATMESTEEAPHGAIYRLNSKAQVMGDRGYLPGTQNEILGLAPLKDGSYLVVGALATPARINAGWVMRINENGGILWQQQYSRGTGSSLTAAHDYNDDYIVVAGKASPMGEGRTAGWVMMLNKNTGEIAWQRYYTGGYAYATRGVLVSEDGLISVMLDGAKDPTVELDPEMLESVFTAGEEANYDYTSLLTIDPRGLLMISDAFYNGKGSDAAQIYFGPRGERIMAGYTDMEYQIEAVADQPAIVKHGIDGWLIAAEQTEPYTDPCKP